MLDGGAQGFWTVRHLGMCFPCGMGAGWLLMDHPTEVKNLESHIFQCCHAKPQICITSISLEALPCT